MFFLNRDRNGSTIESEATYDKTNKSKSMIIKLLWLLVVIKQYICRQFTVCSIVLVTLKKHLSKIVEQPRSRWLVKNEIISRESACFVAFW